VERANAIAKAYSEARLTEADVSSITPLELVASEVRVYAEAAAEIEVLRMKIARSKELPPPQIDGTAQTVEVPAQDISVVPD
jgi:hypothetical protein